MAADKDLISGILKDVSLEVDRDPISVFPALAWTSGREFKRMKY
jgi:hypothetical protein